MRKHSDEAERARTRQFGLPDRGGRKKLHKGYLRGKIGRGTCAYTQTVAKRMVCARGKGSSYVAPRYTNTESAMTMSNDSIRLNMILSCDDGANIYVMLTVLGNDGAKTCLP